MPERTRKSEDEKDPLAVELGRRGGLKGGKARAAKLTKEERVESARKAAQARWANHQKPGQQDKARESSEHTGGNEPPVRRGERMTRARQSVLAAVVLLVGALTLSLVMLTRGSTGTATAFAGKLGQNESTAEKPGLGPNSYEAYLQAAR